MYFEKSYIPDLEEYLKIYYNKILEVNLSNDTYKVVLMQCEEEPKEEKLSEWLARFVEENVHPDDKEMFREKTNYENVKKDSLEVFTNFTYRRKVGKDYTKATFMLMPRHTFTDENQEYFLFVKDTE